MFGIGTQEIILILGLAVIVIGPKKLPELATSLGKGMAQFKKAFDDMKQSAQVDIKTELEKINLLRDNPHLAEAEAKAQELAKAAEAAPPVDPYAETKAQEEAAAAAGPEPAEAEKADPSYKAGEIES